MIGSLHIPNVTNSARNQTYHYAKVLSSGPKVKWAKAGRRVFISEYAGDDVKIAGQSLFVIRERDIVGVCK